MASSGFGLPWKTELMVESSLGEEMGNRKRKSVMRTTGCLWAALRSLAKRCPACSNWRRAPGSCRIIRLKQSVLLIGPKLCNVKLHERSRALGNVFFSVLCLSLFKHLSLYQYVSLHRPVTCGRTGSLTKIVNCKPKTALGCHLSLRAFQEDPIKKPGS